MNPRKLFSLIEAKRKIEDAKFTRMNYIFQTGHPPVDEDEDEEDPDDDGSGALYF